MTDQHEIPTPLSAARLVEVLRQARISHVVIVPDTYQETFIAAIEAAPDLKTVYACSEDEAIGINAGLYAMGHRPLLTIQNNGFYACLNTIRGISLDAGVPTVMLIGQYGNKAATPMEQHPQRMVRLLEPTLDMWGVPSLRLWHDADLGKIPDVYEQALQQQSPWALVVPIPTGV
ncbi:thiamine pyrophosphate-binding protein [Paraburkholderia sp. Ac-20336]|uniref:thiamine pyrophosphate-binding protein n=1 Tax=Paraburkholderia sp. Ac-20336 TaxID=2703886 RepID=UPI00197FF081|nr:thiamine pyrophosphate-binding protein [Paraburkholderia sp. Ac-20336]MBN3803061.1 thiamine pyrophosphate-binding protein [Paraburkholderia sp. Ac-20336]